jgi:hypothetical protein
LTAMSFPATNHLHRCLATEIQKFPSFSMTGATSINVDDPHFTAVRPLTNTDCDEEGPAAADLA